MLGGSMSGGTYNITSMMRKLSIFDAKMSMAEIGSVVINELRNMELAVVHYNPHSCLISGVTIG